MAELGRSLLRWSLILLALLQPLLLDLQSRQMNGTEDASRVRLASLAFLVAIMWLGLLVSRGFCWRANPLRWALVAWAAVIVLATVFSVDPALALGGYFGFRDGAVTLLLYVALLLGLPAALEQRTVSTRLLVLLWVIAAVLCGLYMVGVDHGINPLHLKRGGFMGNADILAPYLIVPFLATFAIFVLGHASRFGRVLMGAALALFTWFFLALGVRGAWLVAAVVLLVLLGYWLWRRIQVQRVFIALLVMAGVFLGCAQVTVGIKERLLNLPQQTLETVLPVQDVDLYASNSGLQRRWIWASVVRLAGERPVLGWGPDTLVTTFAKVAKPIADLDPRMVTKAHSDYLEVLYGQGLLGLAAYLALLGLWLRTIWQRGRQGLLAPWQVAAAIGLVGAFGTLAFEIANVRTMPSLLLLLGMTLTQEKNGVWPNPRPQTRTSQNLDLATLK